MDTPGDFAELQKTISDALISTTRSATSLFAADIPFQRTLDQEIASSLDVQNARLLHLAQQLLENAAPSSDAVGPKLSDVDAIDANWKGVVDVVDSLLEKAATSLDEFTGVVKKLSPNVEQAGPQPKSRLSNFFTSKHLTKPQLSFEHVPLNDETGGFRPLISSKPHAKVSIVDSLKTYQDEQEREQYPHPYQQEIESYQYPQSIYQKADPIPYPDFESTTATFVDSPEALAMMLAELKTAKEIAIDLEHHDNRSYIGMVSLMQISTRDKDWIVDTLVPWRRKLECLNEVFADPSILKVLHGAYMDIIWLQRDLGLYVVGLFDTYHAARSLGYPGASLAYLLKKFANFEAQKQYQLADWRVRPLSDDMFKYARADTHFLLYVYDNMRNELIDASSAQEDKIQTVLKNSRETALQRYEHPIYDPELGQGPVGWYKLIMRHAVHFNTEQFAVFKAVHQWRDNVARKEDESPIFIMPNDALFQIARAIPTDKAALHSTVRHVSHILRIRSDELLQIIAEAKAAGVNGPELDDVLKQIDPIKYSKKAISSGLPLAPALQPPATLPPLCTSPPRTKVSTFWGPLLSKGSTEQQRSASSLGITLALPLPPLNAELFVDPKKTSTTKTPPSRPDHTFVPKEERPKEDEDNGIFIIKQLGGRKRAHGEFTERNGHDAPDTGSAENGGTTPSANVSADQAVLNERARRKEEKRAAKKLRKKEKKKNKSDSAAEGDDPGNGDGDVDMVPFDYANAPSVLRAQEAESENTGGGKGKKKKKEKEKGFDPYKGMKDAPKGLGRAQREGPGRSRTFSS